MIAITAKTLHEIFQLWNFEVVEFFFANAKNQYLEVEVGPHGHWLCLLHDGIRKPFNNGEDLQLEVQNVFRDESWFCVLDIPLAYLPGGSSYAVLWILYCYDISCSYKSY